MRFVLLGVLCVMLSGCALGAATSATAGYSLQAKTADDLSGKARQSIVDESFQRAKEYCDGKDSR